MRGRRLSLALVLVAFVVAVPGFPSDAAQGARPFDVFHQPPGLVLAGDPVTLRVDTDAENAEGVAHVRSRPGGDFRSVPLTATPQGWYRARVPADELTGSILEDYVVVHDPATGRTITVPPGGADAPYRSWIVRDPTTVRLGTHRFGHTREPDAIVARARPGSGPGEVGFACPPEGPCATPWSFDVGPDGNVWVLDTANQRLVGWEPDHRRPTRTIPLSFGAADLAIGPDGTIYVAGAKAGSAGMRLYAFAPDGRHLWTGRLLSEIFNAHLRFGGDGVLYDADGQTGWVPAVDADGRPLLIAQQRAEARPYQPVSANTELVVTGRTSKDREVARVGDAGGLRDAWLITSASDLDVPSDATSALVGGDPVIVFAVYDVARHLIEHVVLQLSPTGGLIDPFSLPRGTDLEATTAVRVGPDGALYQMLNDPKRGVTIVRYALKGAPAVSSTPTSTPSSTEAPPGTPSVLAGGSIAGQPGGSSPTVWFLVAAAIAALVIVVGAAWMRRRSGARGEPPVS